MIDDREIELIVGCAQMASVLDPMQNLERCVSVAQEASRRGVQLLIFPESASSRSDDPHVPPLGEPLDGGFVADLASAVSDLAMTVIVGVTESGSADLPHNTLVALRGGRIISVYRKMHLYDAAGLRESDAISSGDGPVVTFEVDGFRVGMMTCYDIRFPEIARLLASDGADVLAVPTSWVRGPMKELHWTTFCQARAIENTVYVAGAAQTGGMRIGRSMIVAPDGIAEASAGTDTGLVVSRISRDRLHRVREAFPVLRQRRFSIVGTPHPAGEISAAGYPA